MLPGKSVAIGRFAAGRLLLVGIMVLSFLVQGFVTQTHIHNPGSNAAGIALKAGDSAPRHGNVPVNDDPANCRLCQEFLHSGQFVAPASLAFFLPMLAISVIEAAILGVPRFDAVSHSWHSRGPPLG